MKRRNSKLQKNIHRRDAETLRKTKSKSNPEGAEVAEGAERQSSWVSAFQSGVRRCRLKPAPPQRHAIIEVPMKARVFVSFKSTVLDPQGQTVCSALHGLGYQSIAAVRQGKCFDISLADGVTREQARKEIETIAHEVLANPVIEEYRVEILD